SGSADHPRSVASERVVDAREDRIALRPVADVDERDQLRPHQRADTQAADDVEVGEGRIVDVPEHLAGLDERRELELAVHAEELPLVDAGAELGREKRAVEVDEAVAAVAAERAAPAEAVPEPEGRVGAALHVVDESACRQDRVLPLAAERDEVAPLEAERDERRR